MLRLTFFLGLLCCACTAERSISVSDNCGIHTYSVDDENLKLIYSGEMLTSTGCRFTITGGIGKDICSKPETFSLSCDRRVEYHKNYYQSMSPDASYSCDEQISAYCSDGSNLIVVFRQNSFSVSSGSDKVVLILYERDNEFAKKIVDTVATTVYVIIGVVVGVIVLVIIATVIVIICCCRRRTQRSPGNVYTAQPAPYYTGGQNSYPMQNQQPYGYQPNQGFGGYPPNPQGNFQAPAQGGYPPTSQAGMYPPTSQAGYEPPPEYKETGNQQN